MSSSAAWRAGATARPDSSKPGRSERARANPGRDGRVGGGREVMSEDGSLVVRRRHRSARLKTGEQRACHIVYNNVCKISTRAAFASALRGTRGADGVRALPP